MLPVSADVHQAGDQEEPQEDPEDILRPEALMIDQEEIGDRKHDGERNDINRDQAQEVPGRIGHGSQDILDVGFGRDGQHPGHGQHQVCQQREDKQEKAQIIDHIIRIRIILKLPEKCRDQHDAHAGVVCPHDQADRQDLLVSGQGCQDRHGDDGHGRERSHIPDRRFFVS